MLVNEQSRGNAPQGYLTSASVPAVMHARVPCAQNWRRDSQQGKAPSRPRARERTRTRRAPARSAPGTSQCAGPPEADHPGT